jgi:hypothetical protein
MILIVCNTTIQHRMMIESSGYLTRLYQLRAILCRREVTNVCDYLTTLKFRSATDTLQIRYRYANPISDMQKQRTINFFIKAVPLCQYQNIL